MVRAGNCPAICVAEIGTKMALEIKGSVGRLDYLFDERGVL